MDIGSVLARKRANLGLTQKELALKAGVSIETVRDSESGALDVDLIQLRKMSEAMGVRISALVSEAEATDSDYELNFLSDFGGRPN